MESDMPKETRTIADTEGIINELVSMFARSIKQRNESVDYREFNRHSTKASSCYEKLFAMGRVGREALARLLNNEDRGVRCMAAVYLLGYRHAQSMSVLEEVSKGTDLIAYGAQQTIKAWENGEWSWDSEFPMH